MSTSDQFIVITGGPGAGKTTLLDALGRHGFSCIAEAGRAIIRDQTAIGGRGLHQADALLLAELMLTWELRSYREAADRSGPVFFDRGITDLVGYYLLLGQPVPTHVSRAAELFRYHHRVFIAPPWPQIYTKDSERTQDFAEAIRTHDALVEAYTRCGYELIPLPESSVEDRVAFVQANLVESGAEPPARGLAKAPPWDGFPLVPLMHLFRFDHAQSSEWRPVPPRPTWHATREYLPVELRTANRMDLGLG